MDLKSSLQESKQNDTSKCRLLGFLHSLSIEYSLHSTPRFRTMDECKQLRGDIPGIFCKNLFVRDKKKQFYLISAHEDSVVDLKILRKELGAFKCLTFATREELQEILQLEPGEVSPLALFQKLPSSTNIKVILDSVIFDSSHANFHPLDPEATLTLSTESLLHFLEVIGFQPIVHQFSKEEEETEELKQVEESLQSLNVESTE